MVAAQVGVGDMFFKRFLSSAEKSRIQDSIARAEAGTTGEIRVHICHSNEKAPTLDCAKEKFDELKMFQTEHRNAVLLYINLKQKRFAVYGDEGIHQKVSPTFWNEVSEHMVQAIRNQNPIEGIAVAIGEIGDSLKLYFPGNNQNPNELTDEMTES